MKKLHKSFYFIIPVLVLIFFFIIKDSSDKIIPVQGKRIYISSSGSGYNQNKFGIYIPEKYFSSTSLPLLIASHGDSGNGESEIIAWKDIAEQYGVIVVTPSYACATNIAKDNQQKKEFIKQEKEMLKEILERVTGSLNIDRRFIMHSGFSGGGTPIWYVATSFPEFFNAFCMQSANFYGRDFSPINYLVTWRDVPTYIFWSRDDNEVLTGNGYKTLIGEGQEALNFMRKKKFKNLKHRIFPEGGHIPRREEAARWFSEEIVNKQKNSDIQKTDIVKVDLKKVKKAIDASAYYLQKSCREDGKFRYCINLDPEVKLDDDYNMLRHEGAIYALSQYQEYSPDKGNLEVLVRASEYLKKKTIFPLKKKKDLLAVWSDPKITGQKSPLTAKLGGAGLGLVALLSLEKVKPGSTNIETLQKLGGFILFMQKRDGSYYSKFIPSMGGYSKRFKSLYYPGEAALGLVMLYELDNDPKWLQGALDTIAYLAESREGQAVVPADHWALLATSKLLPYYDKCPNKKISREKIVSHAEQICRSIIDTAPGFNPDNPEFGSFSVDGRGCPTATRLEGLIAALSLIPEDNRDLRQMVIQKITEGVDFLLRLRIKEGEYAGGYTRALRKLKKDSPYYSKSFNRRAGEIRIDYVQHSLSALIMFNDCFDKYFIFEQTEAPDKILIKYFNQPGCPECDMVDEFIKPRLAAEFKDKYLLESIDINITENIKKLIKYQEKFRIPEDKADQPVSMVVNGKVFLNGYKEIEEGVYKAVRDEFDSLQHSRNPREVEKKVELNKDDVLDDQVVKDRFRKFRLLGVLLAGFLDGINPCVFAALIFFISLLSVSQIRGQKLLITGSVYCVACFLTYLALGFGLFRFLKLFSGYKTIQAGINFTMAAILLVIAFVSFRDAWNYKKTGKADDINLQLPDKLKNTVHNVMKKGLAYRHLIPGAFVIGVVVTAVESVCTGQVYLPTLIYLSKLGEMNALIYLLLYNFAFIVPLVIIFIAAYFGVSTPGLIEWSKKNVFPAKVLMGCFFIGMAVLLVFL